MNPPATPNTTALDNMTAVLAECTIKYILLYENDIVPIEISL